ncbi:MAG: hypothetical protein ACRD82_14880 [Blastocatellia bacterium]
MKSVLMFVSAMLLALLIESGAAAAPADDLTVERVRRIVEEVKTASFPELKNTEIEIKLFTSRSDYFQSRFTFTSFLFGKRLRCLLKVNRNVFADGAPEDGLRAIIAHELGHALYYKSRNRLKLLGLVRLAGKDFTARFERSTDLEAITRDYAEGLKTYRHWLYNRIPAEKLAEKKRNYFSPEEIDAIELKRSQPELLKQWRKHPPRSLPEIEQAKISRISVRLLLVDLSLAR